MEAHRWAQKRREIFSLKELCQIPARRDRRECAIQRLDVQKVLELTGISEGAMRRPN
jgi:hypothetical protein